MLAYVWDPRSGETRDVVVEADVPAGMEDAMLWTAELRYFDLISNRYQNHNCCAPIVTRGAGNGSPVPASNGAFEYVAQHRRRVDATAAIDEGVRLADCGEMKEASEHLKVSSPTHPSVQCCGMFVSFDLCILIKYHTIPEGLPALSTGMTESHLCFKVCCPLILILSFVSIIVDGSVFWG